jgi:hypothetical protein
LACNNNHILDGRCSNGLKGRVDRRRRRRKGRRIERRAEGEEKAVEKVGNWQSLKREKNE